MLENKGDGVTPLTILMALLKKIQYALTRPSYLWQRLSNPIYRVTNYDYGQWARVVMHRELFQLVQTWHPQQLKVLEISPGGSDSPWRSLGFSDYVGLDYPQFDICNDKLDTQFDLIIADQVFEHLLWPYRAARNIHAMLKPGGRFINTTPFLIRIHENPVDCSRWTETGIKHLFAEAGFELDKITTGSWGNLACARANLIAPTWARVGWGKPLHNQPEFPITVWAIAEK